MHTGDQRIHHDDALFSGCDVENGAVITNTQRNLRGGPFRTMEDLINQFKLVHGDIRAYALLDSPARRSRTPFTNLKLSVAPKRCAISTASLIATPLGISGRKRIS